MLNYIWSGLIIVSLVFALTVDSQELINNRFRNEAALSITVSFPESFDPEARRQPVEIRLNPNEYRTFYNVDAAPDSTYTGTLVQTREGRQIQFSSNASLPEPLETIRSFHESDENTALRGTLLNASLGSGTKMTEAGLQFEI